MPRKLLLALGLQMALLMLSLYGQMTSKHSCKQRLLMSAQQLIRASLRILIARITTLLSCICVISQRKHQYGPSSHPRVDLDDGLKGDPKGAQSCLNKQDFARSLRELYGALSTSSPSMAAVPRARLGGFINNFLLLWIPCCVSGLSARLLLSADQGLQAVPYAALHDGETVFGRAFWFGLNAFADADSLGKPRAVGGANPCFGASRFEGLAPDWFLLSSRVWSVIRI